MSERLAFVVDSGTDVRLVDGLAEHFEVSVFARRIAGGREINWEPTHPVSVRVGPESRLRFAYWASRRLAEFDFILVQGYGLAALAANLAARHRLHPPVMLVCSPIERYYAARKDNPVSGMPFRRGEFAMIKRIARWNGRIGMRYVALSEHLADVIRSHEPEGSIHVIPVYGVDTECFRPTERPRAEIRRELGLPETGALAFFSSRVAPEKDAATLVAAAARVIRTGRDLRLLNLGGGHREFLALAEREGIADRVIGRGAVHPVRDLPAYYQASDLCIQTSREEGLGFSALEALACEVPVVASAVGGLEETIIPDESGWTHDVGDTAGLVRAMIEVLEHPTEGVRRARYGRELVHMRYEKRGAFERLADVLTTR